MVPNPRAELDITGAQARRRRDPSLIIVGAFAISVAAGGFMLATTPLAGLDDHHLLSSMETYHVINFVIFTLGLLLVYLGMVGATTRASSSPVSAKAANFLVFLTLTLSLAALLLVHPLIFPVA